MLDMSPASSLVRDPKTCTVFNQLVFSSIENLHQKVLKDANKMMEYEVYYRNI